VGGGLVDTDPRPGAPPTPVVAATATVRRPKGLGVAPS
jgi:hypothetical protein